MLRLIEFLILGASVLVVIGLIISGRKSGPPAPEETPLGATEPHQSEDEKRRA